MRDPKPLLRDGATDLERRLLAAGRRDAPSQASRRRILKGLGLGVVLPSTVASHASASSWLASITRNALVRSGLGGAVGAAAIWAGVQAVSPETPPPAASTTPAPAAPSPPARVEPSPEPEPEPEPSVADSASPSSASPPSTSRVTRSARGGGSPSIADEVASLDGARRALLSGDARASLRALDEHARRFTRPRLGAEAAVLRIEALVRSGQRGRATQLGKQFLARHANGPYERRVRSLLSDAEARDSAR